MLRVGERRSAQTQTERRADSVQIGAACCNVSRETLWRPVAEVPRQTEWGGLVVFHVKHAAGVATAVHVDWSAVEGAFTPCFT